jgi:ActR/RegA family two-component response regulator
MPGLSGLELQDRLADKGISFPIIFITGHGTVPTSVRAFKAGAMYFLQKPFEGRDLLDAPHWTKVQYLSPFNSHKFHIICSERSLFREKPFVSFTGPFYQDRQR